MPEESQALELRPQLFICVSCWRGGVSAATEGVQSDGRRLYERLRALLAGMDADAPVRLLPNLCFANCKRGCNAGISAPGKWSYLMGDLGPEHAEDLLAYARTYAAAATGVVLPSKRPASLETTVIARFPAPVTEIKDAAE